MDPDRTEHLLGDLQWLQGLAHQLVRDPDRAADAVQETCVLALGHGGAIAHRRAFLATVLRRCLWLQQRRADRRRRREQTVAVAGDAADAGTAELVLRAELQQRLVAAVLGLPAAHRDAVLLRFFDGLPPRAIAERLGVPVATVHSRLQRALQQLRSRLDGDAGGRAAWVATALAWPRHSLSGRITDWIVQHIAAGAWMQTKWKVAALAVLAAGSMTWWWSRGDADGGPAAALASGSPAAATRGGGGGGGDGSGGATGTTARRTAAPPVANEREPLPRRTVRGRVCGCDGIALAGVPVSATTAVAAARSDSTGAFELQLLPEPVSLLVDDPKFVTVMGARWTPDSTVEPVLVVAAALQLAGNVSDARALPVAGARVSIELPDDFDARFPLPLDRGERLRWSARTDGDGRFDLGRVPAISGARLLAVADALRPTSVPQPPGDDRAVQIVLQPFAFEDGQLAGKVVDPGGVPVPGASVAMGVTSVTSDADGRFALSLRRAGWPTAIVAAKQGYLPGRFELPRGGGADRDDWPDEVVLRLGGAPLSIHGRVVDQDGQPIEQALVWIDDPTPLGIAGMLPVRVEYLLGGGQLPRQAATMPVPLADEPAREDLFMDQTTARTVPTACWYFVRSDEGGRFEVPGLLPRDYRLRAFDPATGLTATADAVPAGGSADVCIVRDGLLPLLRGRVVSLSGAPLAGVEVIGSLAIHSARDRVPGGWFAGSVRPETARTRTSADGTFALEGVHRERAVLTFQSDAILPRGIDVRDLADPLDVIVEVEARCHVEVALLDPGEADEVLALRDDGEQVDIAVLRSGSHQALTELPLHEGRSGVFVLGERARTLVLRRDGQPVRSVPLQLQPGTTFRVQ